MRIRAVIRMKSSILAGLMCQNFLFGVGGADFRVGGSRVVSRTGELSCTEGTR